jgi:L-alanine-DL-glutamate epimerase-like enolase superfamily enzyme
VPSRLARILCASPFDAAIHDAAGIALGISSFSFYDAPAPVPIADPHFPGSGACAAIRECLRPPARELNAWWVVGKDDSFEDEVGPAVRRGYRGFKLKIMGRDPAADARRIAEVHRAVVRLGASDPRLVADSNEANPDAASVRDMLERLRSMDAGAYGALDYLEQPTARDIVAHRHDWREVSRLKPVMLDEGLTGLDLLEEARSQGWGGLALKTCKGHSFSLACAAWAKRCGMRVSIQDLTNPGLALLHAALFAAHVPTCNGVELNSPQYTPAANAAWLPRLPDLFEPKGGLHRIPDPIPPGLGSSL